MSQLCWRGLLIKKKENVILCNTKSSFSNSFIKSFVTTNSSKEFLQVASERLNVKEMSDWYNVTQEDLLRVGARSLLKQFKSSPSLLITNAFPEYTFLPWKFQTCPQHYWDNIENQKSFMNWASNELKITQMDDWYKITKQDFRNIGGSSLLNKYKNSPSLLLSSLFPNYDWLPWKFGLCTKKFWDDIKNQRKFVDWLGTQLEIKERENWYKVVGKDFIDFGGFTLLKKYGFSPYHLMSSVYPEYEWLPWKFASVPKLFWKEDKNVKWFLDWAGKQLGIKEPSDWNKVMNKELIKLGANSLFEERRMSLIHLLSIIYPDQFFPPKTGFNKKTQNTIKAMLKSIFHGHEVLEEYRHSDIVTSSGAPLELDFFYPDLKIAVEYQGQQHYKNVNMFSRSSLDENKSRDLQKSDLCKNKGITLIEIPYWWDRKYESLAATVYGYRPDLFKEQPSSNPIPALPPTNAETVPIDYSMRKKLMTSTVWEKGSMNPTGWWMTEKYDGMRLYWDGVQFFTRQGKKVKAPEAFTSQMPNIELDGEIWTQYGLYQDAASLTSNPEKWERATYWVFDVPSKSQEPFESRIEFLNTLKQEGNLPKWVKVVEAVECKDEAHLQAFFDEIINKKGEGVMLREPQSLYTIGRSKSLRKYKPFFDTEVQVLENNYPHGLNCKQLNGKNLFVGLGENGDEAKKVKEGSVITVKHLGTNAYGTLQYPKFYRERTDVKWDDLIKTEFA